MKKVKYHWICFLQDEEKMHNVREVMLLENAEVHFRSNDTDGETRYYTWSVSKFESTFKINLLDYI